MFFLCNINKLALYLDSLKIIFLSFVIFLELKAKYIQNMK